MAVHLPMLAPVAPARPRTRAECVDSERPCPFVSCRYHLAIDVDPATGEIVAERELEGLTETCVLDVADRDGASLDVVGAAIGSDRTTLQKTEQRALERLSRRAVARNVLVQFLEPGPRYRVDRRPKERPVAYHVIRDGEIVDAEELAALDALAELADEAHATLGGFFHSDASACALVHRILTKREHDREASPSGPRESDDEAHAGDAEPDAYAEQPDAADPYAVPDEREIYDDE